MIVGAYSHYVGMESLFETVFNPDGSSPTFFCPVGVFWWHDGLSGGFYSAGQQDLTGAAGSPGAHTANSPALSKTIMQGAPHNARAPINNERD